MHVLITGGGSAGHVTPALAVASELHARGCRLSYVGSNSGLEERLVAASGMDFHGIAAGKLRRYLSIENLRDVGRVLLGIGQAWRLLGRLRPDVIFSKGGFVAFPVVFAGWLRRIPVVAHESDFSPGLANRLSQPFLRALCVSFAETAVGVPGATHTGSPVRQALLKGDATAGRRRLGFAAEKPIVLVTGGSLGAQDLNRAVAEALPALLARWQVVHVCGAAETLPESQPGYVPFSYVDEGWGDILAAADVVVSRAGANALFELLALRKLHLLVPLPATASRGDQIENAAFARSHGYSDVLRNDLLGGPSLNDALEALWANREARLEALERFDVPPAALRISDLIQDAAAADS